MACSEIGFSALTDLVRPPGRRGRVPVQDNHPGNSIRSNGLSDHVIGRIYHQQEVRPAEQARSNSLGGSVASGEQKPSAQRGDESEFAFSEPETAAWDISDSRLLSRLIVERLCGETSYPEPADDTYESLTTLLKHAPDGLDYGEFNELLLLLNQDRVSRDFYDFFFGPGRVTLENLRRGVTRFRGFAMLRFGNFRFAYKDLITKKAEGVLRALAPYTVPTNRLKEEFDQRRPSIALGLTEIPKDKTWLLGYVAKRLLEDDVERLKEREAASSSLEDQREVEMLGLKYGPLVEAREMLERAALKNTDIYLAWDYMDVYVATSMRSRWEFEETYEFVAALFSSRALSRLKLRWFDPTQSLCRNRIDKGLVESLMLKRARCTVYMAQEIDSMGKDSELAATLAQGKPVVVYVPLADSDALEKKIQRFPLEYLVRRFLIHRADGTFDDARYRPSFEALDSGFEESIEEFLQASRVHRSEQPFVLWEEKEEEFRTRLGDRYQKVCKLLAMAEQYHYERRAEMLARTHPLAVQVNLASGVANGVLVVRSVDDCVNLLHGILTNSMAFTIRHLEEVGAGVTVLEEEISRCPFRVVTDYERLTNSFWNFYLEDS
jgi:hypothetical protein